MSSGKRCPICLGLNVLKHVLDVFVVTMHEGTRNQEVISPKKKLSAVLIIWFILFTHFEYFHFYIWLEYDRHKKGVVH